MINLSTFEDIFNKLVELYQGKYVDVVSKQDNITISNFSLKIDNIKIKPLSKRKSKKWNEKGQKVGLIVISAKNLKNSFNIPFILGFDTMKATFIKDGVRIKSLDIEFLIKKSKNNNRKLKQAN